MLGELNSTPSNFDLIRYFRVVVLKLILKTPLYTSIIMDCKDLCLHGLYLSVVTILQPPSVVCEGSLFSRALPKCVIYCLFDVSHADSWEWYFCILIFFSWWLVMLSIFSCCLLQLLLFWPLWRSLSLAPVFLWYVPLAEFCCFKNSVSVTRGVSLLILAGCLPWNPFT